MNAQPAIENLNRQAERQKNWHEALEALRQMGGFVADMLDWKALPGVSEQTLPERVGNEVRGSLLLSTLRTIAADAPPNVLLNLVRCGHWNPEQAFAYVQQMNDEEKRVDAIEELLDLASGLPHEQIVEIAQSFREDWYHFRTLVALTPYMPPELMPQALEMVQSIQDENYRSQVLIAIAGHMQGERLFLWECAAGNGGAGKTPGGAADHRRPCARLPGAWWRRGDRRDGTCY